jgi:sporulation protein YlmC with PRC-barrel domain
VDDDQLDALRGLHSRPVYSSDGEYLGAVEQVFVEAETNVPRWVGIGAGPLRVNQVLVPLAGPRSGPRRSGPRIRRIW